MLFLYQKEVITMLVQFMMKNVLSFKDETVLDMTAITAYKEHSYNLIQSNSDDKFLKVAAIYGANASGKSNLYLGMELFQSLVMRSMNSVGEIEENILAKYFNPFAFEENASNSEFQIILNIENNEYTYGFEFNSVEIASEWLYKRDLTTNRKSIILERNHQDISMGSSVRRICDKYKNQIPKETLALTFFSKLNLQTFVFVDVFKEIRGMIIVDTDFYERHFVIEKLLPEVIDEKKADLLEFLSAIDTGIKNIRYEMVDKKIQFFTTHIGRDGKDYTINLYSESQGTLKSIIIFMFATSVILKNGIMVVDELNVKLHPLLLKFIVDLFNNPHSKAQLIYTTHDTTLLDRKFFRRDQIWFVQKDEYGYSELTALSDFKIRSDASFEKDYLSGVYGGIPSFKDFSLKEDE